MKKRTRSHTLCCVCRWVERVGGLLVCDPADYSTCVKRLTRRRHLNIRLWLVFLSEWFCYRDEKDAHGFPPDTLRGAMAAVGKRQSMIGNTATAPGGTAAVPRSISQPGNCSGGPISFSHLCSCLLDGVDFSYELWRQDSQKYKRTLSSISAFTSSDLSWGLCCSSWPGW